MTNVWTDGLIDGLELLDLQSRTDRFQLRPAMAGAIILTIMIAICTFINNRYLRKIVRY